MGPFETSPATQSSVDPFGTPPATPRPAVDVADFVNALWRRRGARGARHWSAGGATGGARSLTDSGVHGVCAERATGAPKARRAERASAQAEHAGRRWSRGVARGARHWGAEGATGGVSAGGARWQTVESWAKRGARDSSRSEAIKHVTFF